MNAQHPPGGQGGVRRLDHVGITVADLEAATAFFTSIGLVPDGPPMIVQGEFLDAVIGMRGAKIRIVMLHAPEGGATLELSSFTRPDHTAGTLEPMANAPGIRNVAFEVDDLDAVLARLAADGYSLVGGVGRYEQAWRMSYVRGPEGIIVSLAQRVSAHHASA